MKDLFDTQQKIDQAVADFTTLLSHPGWILVQTILDANIEVLKEQLESGTEDETKEDVDRTRYKLSISKLTRDLPHNMIAQLQESEGETPLVDPFDTVEQLRKRRESGEEV